MWVRTQDKLGLFELKGVKIREHGFENGTKEYLVLNNDNLYNHLGTYKSKERALEVLDEIQKKINDIKKDFLMACMREKGVYDVIAWNNFVYQMPEV